MNATKTKKSFPTRIDLAADVARSAHEVRDEMVVIGP